MSDSVEKVALVFLSGGKGSRMGISSVPKQYVKIRGREAALLSLQVFLQHPSFEEIVIVCDSEYRDLFRRAFPERSFSFADPGRRRQDSFRNGLQEIRGDNPLVCVHDAARPLLDKALLQRVLSEALKNGAAAAGITPSSTFKEVDEQGYVVRTIPRDSLREIQTPQAARKKSFLQGFQRLLESGKEVTDDVSLLEGIGQPVKVVEGNRRNMKLTYPIDYQMLSFFSGDRE